MREITIHEEYAVTDSGDVISYKRETRTVLSLDTSKQGYKRVALYTKSGRIKPLVHRLVCEAFNGPPPTARSEVNHRNADKADNSPINLEWTDAASNRLHAATMGLLPKGDSHSCSKLTSSSVLLARSMYSSGHTYKTIAEILGVSNGCVGAVIRGETWKHIQPTGSHSNTTPL